MRALSPLMAGAGTAATMAALAAFRPAVAALKVLAAWVCAPVAADELCAVVILPFGVAEDLFVPVALLGDGRVDGRFALGLLAAVAANALRDGGAVSDAWRRARAPWSGAEGREEEAGRLAALLRTTGWNRATELTG
eukprot:gene7872-66068_t